MQTIKIAVFFLQKRPRHRSRMLLKDLNSYLILFWSVKREANETPLSMQIKYGITDHFHKLFVSKMSVSLAVFLSWPAAISILSWDSVPDV